MTISTAAVPLSYAGNGSTTGFAVTWIYIAKSHVVVTLRDAAGVETLQILDTDYSLTDPGSTGTVEMTNAPASGETLVITSEPPNTQETDIPLGGSFPARSVEDALDLASQVSQKVNAIIDRSLIVPKTDLRSGSDLEIPNETDRALRFLSFDSDGKPIVTAVAPVGGAVVTPFAETYLDDLTAIDVLATIGAPDLDADNSFSGKNTFTKSLVQKAASDIASAGTIDLTAAIGNGGHVTGTTTITIVTLEAGKFFLVIFDGVLTLTHDATNNNLNNGGANITTAVGDRCLYWSDGTTVYGIYTRADGTALT